MKIVEYSNTLQGTEKVNRFTIEIPDELFVEWTKPDTNDEIFNMIGQSFCAALLQYNNEFFGVD